MIHHKEHTLVVGSLVPSTSDSNLKDAFEEFGHLVSAKVFKNEWTGKCTWYGFVVFHNKSAMEAAIQEMDEAELGGKFITVTIVRPGFGRPREIYPKVFIVSVFLELVQEDLGKTATSVANLGILPRNVEKK
ncbi:hypothetical protein OROHE_002452 [Orobanche hederae]